MIVRIEACLADMGERVIYGALFRHALVLVEIGLKLLFRLFGVDHKLPLRAEGQLADIAIRSAGSAPDESHDDEFAVRHCAIMAGRFM